MTRLILAAGVAALAITAPASAAPGGKGGEHGHAQQQKQQRGGAQAQARGNARVQAGNAHVQARVAARAQVKAERRADARQNDSHAARVAANHRQQARNRAEARADARVTQKANARRVEVRQAERAQQIRRNEVRQAMIRRNEQLGRNNAPVLAMRDRDRLRFENRVAMGYGVGGCPPGLANKAVACMPPGQARKLLVGQRLNALRERVAFRELPNRLRYVYRDTPDYYYRYGDGYVYRVNRTNDVVSSLLPLFGLGYGIGQPFPTTYASAYMPAAYQPFYPDTPYTSYRYANGYVYQVDPITGLIEDVDPALGYGYGYGQMLPAAYSAYNVPYQYRPYYYDTADTYYRYAPGAIYQVDPSTSLITAVASLLSPGLTVGQPLPMGYSAYNVPYAYRTNYYDTPDAWYRYANGNIYRVDPTTQLVTALVAAALT